MAVGTAWSSLTLVIDWSKWFAISCILPFTISTQLGVMQSTWQSLENNSVKFGYILI
jgi:hypothetical protein